jgi:hypothetical protein
VTHNHKTLSIVVGCCAIAVCVAATTGAIMSYVVARRTPVELVGAWSESPSTSVSAPFVLVFTRNGEWYDIALDGSENQRGYCLVRGGRLRLLLDGQSPFVAWLDNPDVWSWGQYAEWEVVTAEPSQFEVVESITTNEPRRRSFVRVVR